MDKVEKIGTAIVVLVILGTLGVCFYSSCRSAEIYNSRMGTNYSCSDFFWAKDQINTQTQTLKLIELKGLSQ